MPIDKEKLQRILNRFSKATIRAAMADRPEIMQASGWDYDKDGNLVQGDPNAEGPVKLREALDAISIPVAVDNVGNVAGAALMGIPAVRNLVLSAEASKILRQNAHTFNGGTVKDAVNPRTRFRGTVYKGGDIRDARYATFTTDRDYAAQYGVPHKYLVDAPSPTETAKPIIGSSDPVTADMNIFEWTGGNSASKAIIGHDAVTGELPRMSRGVEVVSLSPDNITELPAEFELPAVDFISREGRYSGYTPTIQSSSAKTFVQDVNEGVRWGKSRGEYKPAKNEVYFFDGRLFDKQGAEMGVFFDNQHPERVLKVPHSGAVDESFARRMPLDGFDTSSEAFEYGKALADFRNRKPYNLRLSVEGVSPSTFDDSKRVPVLSQKRVKVAKPASDQKALNSLSEMIGADWHIKTTRARPNEIMFENNLIKDWFGYDFKPSNVGILDDGTAIGIDLLKDGGKIHIAPSKKGTFTAAATKHGKSVQEFASQVLAHKENSSPAMVKKANFARNASRWHSEGGFLNPVPDGIDTKKYSADATSATGDKYYDIVDSRYHGAMDAMKRRGMSYADAYRLAPMIVTQNTLEGGWRLNRNDNNFAGMKSNGKTMQFDSLDDFYDAYFDMLDSKWTMGNGRQNNWRNAQNLDDWSYILNREDLNLWNEDLFNQYNREHRDNPAYLYAPEWENGNKKYREHLRKTEARTNAYLQQVYKNHPVEDWDVKKAVEAEKLQGITAKYGIEKIREFLQKMKQSK